ncbi:hypothetical protein R5R35_003967 [Gryllus longicercus]|uniref:Uncharacterized protein n=1 Tax=Gryllus longicercus TaxID=2509291 RepID=A0AAN9VJ10_9ORTH
MPSRPTALVLLLLVVMVLAVTAPTAEAHKSKKDDPETTTEEEHHKSIELRHFHHHHRHYHHYRDRSKHWVAGLLLALVCAVLGSCAAVGLWRRYCTQNPCGPGGLQLQRPCPPFGRRVAVAVDAPLLQPPPLPLLADAPKKEAPPPYKDTWA